MIDGLKIRTCFIWLNEDFIGSSARFRRGACHFCILQARVGPISSQGKCWECWPFTRGPKKQVRDRYEKTKSCKALAGKAAMSLSSTSEQK